MDFNIAKINIPINMQMEKLIKKAFDQGKIEEVYNKICMCADEWAAKDTERYISKIPLEYIDEEMQEMDGAEPQKGSRSLRVANKISDYREQRFQYHLGNMFKLLELYVKAKTKSNTK